MTKRAPHAPPIRRERQKRLVYPVALLGVLAVCSGGMLALGVPNLLTGEGFVLAAKVILITVAATVVAFTVNKFALERGAPLAAIGYPLSGCIAVASMLFVGIGLWMATFAGLVYDDAAHLDLQKHGTAVVETVAARNGSASRAGRVGPVMEAIVTDLRQKRDCEIRSSCVSGRTGGYGTVARAIEEKLGRAEAIASEVERGRAQRQAAVRTLNARIADYQETLAHSSKGIDERRGDLQLIDAEIRQVIADLDEAMPLTLLAAYAEELAAGTTVPERAEANRRLNGILRAHAASLRAVLESMEPGDATYPPFPGRTGVVDTLRYTLHFLPLAAITAVVEAVLPLTLWGYALLFLDWRNYRREPPRPPARPKPDPFGGLLDDEPSETGSDDHEVPSLPAPGRSRRPRIKGPRHRANGRLRNGRGNGLEPGE